MLPNPDDAPLTILLVEDNWVNQIISKELLKTLGQSCDLATSGEQCLEMVKLRPYDLVLLDIEMPGINGFETLRFLREWEIATGTLPRYVVACTAFGSSNQRQLCLNAGMNGFLAKPLKRELVVQVLEDVRSARR